MDSKSKITKKEYYKLSVYNMFRLTEKICKYFFYKLIRTPFLMRIEYHVVDHCNLNCAACEHFSNIAPEGYRDIDEFDKEIAAISAKVKLDEFRIMGGEPLLHPKIESFFETARKHFPKTRITLCTNCVLLKKMNMVFWNSMRKNNIGISVTVYPPMKDQFNEIIRLIKENKVGITHMHLADIFDRGMNMGGVW